MMQTDQQDLGTKIKALQMIHLTMMGGVLMFAATPYILGGKRNPAEDFTFMAAICTAVFVGTTVASVLVPRIIIQQALRKYSTGVAYTSATLFILLQTGHIIRMALQEGSALLGCLMFFVSKDPVFLVFPGMFLFLGCILFPTRTRLLALIQTMEEKIRQGM